MNRQVNDNSTAAADSTTNIGETITTTSKSDSSPPLIRMQPAIITTTTTATDKTTIKDKPTNTSAKNTVKPFDPFEGITLKWTGKPAKKILIKKPWGNIRGYTKDHGYGYLKFGNKTKKIQLCQK